MAPSNRIEVLIGHCLLAEPAPDVRLSAYVLPDRVLAIALNSGADGARAFRYDLTLWMPVQSGVPMTRTDEDGPTTPTGPMSLAGTITTSELKFFGLKVCGRKVPQPEAKREESHAQLHSPD
ncbi:MAG: hypothetical protein JXQ71_00250 [Verrucomicrobia bacterium]|nr:hypothetical protein [Verrucomicrobiota bacterium]